MRLALIILIGIHGIIHLFGFLKAFEISEFNAISQPISKTYGIFWLLTFLLFVITIIFYSVHYDYWWLSGLLAIVVSQVLIFNYWSDAKFGTIANLIILFATIIGYSNFNFELKIKEEREDLFEGSQFKKDQEIISRKSLNDLPPLVQKWLTNSGVVGKQTISNVYLTQELQLKLKPDQENWNSGKAEQYFTIQPPAFNWSINTEMNSILSVVGRDKFNDGKGEMTIKLLSLIPVANAKDEKKVDQATLQRYLAEIVWFPSASLSPYITWETIDDYSAGATMDYKGTKGSGKFYFDEYGNFEKFVAMRYQDSNDTEPTEWTVAATKTEEMSGIKIPVECEASWELKGGKWTWLKLKITDIQYNVKKMPVANNVYKE
ncbi:MAG: hypothetical protein HND52_12940 [Ignavibacteriae bacterium]|nr:hypothetical protein [Ignavibacteriota bacterium]NOG98858.1 hypothetical protein [Ignavibacteriota bacterium]